VILLHNVVQISALSYQNVFPSLIFSSKPTQTHMTRFMSIERDLARPSGRAGHRRLAEKGHRRSDSALGLK